MASFDLNNCKVGQYHYSPRFNSWGVWKCVYNDGKHASGEKVASFQTQQEAKAYVYKMNGWTMKTA